MRELRAKLIRWLAYLGGWTLFALFFISEDAGRANLTRAAPSNGTVIWWYG
ncbi:MAG TPA: hypothetical protein VN924_25790 [Bryobacteraceae bacterium]|nr:hypothetical protein [Bryobacteraceae bacterium]